MPSGETGCPMSDAACHPRVMPPGDQAVVSVLRDDHRPAARCGPFIGPSGVRVAAPLGGAGRRSSRLSSVDILGSAPDGQADEQTQSPSCCWRSGSPCSIMSGSGSIAPSGDSSLLSRPRRGVRPVLSVRTGPVPFRRWDARADPRRRSRTVVRGPAGSGCCTGRRIRGRSPARRRRAPWRAGCCGTRCTCRRSALR